MAVEENLVDVVWGKAKPPRPNEMVKILGTEFAGKKFEDKLEDLRKELDKKKSAGFVVCMVPSMTLHSSNANGLLAMLDEIAWLYNLRGNEYTTAI